ncbi:unnamed protein product, partial [Hapterophycus canaliculatus]
SSSNERGWQEDTHSLVQIEDGGVFELQGQANHDASTMTVVTHRYTKDPSWMVAHRLRQHHRWGQERTARQNMKERGQQDSDDPSLAEKRLHSPFTPEASSGYTFAQRLRLSPPRLKVGEELRFPSSMTDVLTGSVMSLGVDGSLLLAQAHHLDEETLEATT